MNHQFLPKKKISLRAKTILIIFGLFLCAMLLEAGLRIGEFVFLSLQEYKSRLSIQEKGTYRILCLGESTTANAWPHPLEEILNQQAIGIKFSVVDKGVPGTTLARILSQLEYNLTEYNPDMLIVMAGIHDERGFGIYQDMTYSFFRSCTFLKNLKVYNLVKFLWIHIVNKTREIRIHRLLEKDIITTRTTNLKRPFLFKDQENEYKKAIDIDPKDVDAYLELGLNYEHSGLYDRARDMYKKAIEINRLAFRSYYALGYCYKYLGRYDETEEVIKKAIEIYPKDDRAYGALAILYIEQGKNKLAGEYFKKADRLRIKKYNPNNTTVL